LYTPAVLTLLRIFEDTDFTVGTGIFDLASYKLVVSSVIGGSQATCGSFYVDGTGPSVDVDDLLSISPRRRM